MKGRSQNLSLVKKPVSLLKLKGGCKDDIKQDYFCIRLLTERIGIQLNYLYENYHKAKSENKENGHLSLVARPRRKLQNILATQMN